MLKYFFPPNFQIFFSFLARMLWVWCGLFGFWLPSIFMLILAANNLWDLGHHIQLFGASHSLFLKRCSQLPLALSGIYHLYFIITDGGLLMCQASFVVIYIISSFNSPSDLWGRHHFCLSYRWRTWGTSHGNTGGGVFSCCDELPQGTGLKLQTFISLSPGGWEVSDQDARRSSAGWEPVSWFLDGCLLAVTSCSRRGEGVLWGFFISPLCEASTFMAWSPPKGPISEYQHIEGWDFNRRILWGPCKL